MLVELEDLEWEKKYVELRTYYEQQNHSSLPEESGEVSYWVREQRQARHEGNLMHEKMELLNMLNFDWESGAADWMLSFLEVKAKCEGSTSCTINRKDDPELGLWLSDQRAAHRHTRLSQLRERLLSEIGVNMHK